MQTIILSDQETEQSQLPVSVNHPIGTLFFGLLLGFLFMLFDRQNQPHALAVQPERTGGWGRTLGILLLVGVTIFVLINVITGP